MLYRIGLGPNVDFFAMADLEALAKKFKDQHLNQDFDQQEEGKRDATMAGIFDDNLRNA